MKPVSDVRKPYSGNTRSLVIALDVGTTFSGVSYAILEPGEVPKIHGVTRFPGQEHVAGNSKIPSLMYYDKRGKMQAAGAEAESASVLSQAEDEGWIKAELFKLRMRPKTMKLQMNGMRLDPLPRNKNSTDVFGDFLSYLFRCTRNFITDTHANGAALWDAVHHDMQFVLSHPNGWEGAQQTKMRRAAIYGGLIPDTDEGKARIRFVTEGEASLHACVLNGLAADVLNSPSRHGFLVADAGGGTLDISSYAIRGTVPLVIEEIAPPDCVFSGSVFVSRRARAFLQEKLKNSKYGTPDAVDHITKRFDETTKRLFRDKKDLQFIPFGSPLDKDMAVGIRGGQLKLTGAEIAELFEPSVEAAVSSIRAQIEASQGVVRSVWLVGGFAASPWLFSQLQERLAPLRVTVSRPDSQTSKAVADGAIGFYCDHHVSARMSKFMYGVEFLREYDSRDQEHIARRNRLCELPSGPRLLPDAFDCILARSVKVKESTVFSRKYCTELTSLSTLSVFEVEIWCFRGPGNTVPQWILRQAEEFSTLCVVRADLSPLSGSAQAKQGRNGKTYWTIVFSVEIHFGLTEFRARIKWIDNGRTRYGPASIVYNESGSRGEEEEADSAPEDDAANGIRSRAVSRGHSPASFAPGGYTNKLGSAVEFPKAESVQNSPYPDAQRGFERERASSRGIPASVAAPLTDDRGHSRRGSEMGYEPPVQASTKDKGKDRERERERERQTSGASAFGDRSLPAHSRTTSTNSKIGEALTDVWGATKAGTPSASPLIDPKSSPYGASTKASAPKVDTPKTMTKERTRDSSRVGDRLAPPDASASIYGATPPLQMDTQSVLEAKEEPSPSAGPGSSWGNNGTSWNNDNTATGYGNEPEVTNVVEEPPPPPAPLDKKGKKKNDKTSKLNSKAASVVPTPGTKTPMERQKSNDWANLGIDPIPETTTNIAHDVPGVFDMAADHKHPEEPLAEEPVGDSWGMAPAKPSKSPKSSGWGAEKNSGDTGGGFGSSFGSGGGGGGGFGSSGGGFGFGSGGGSGGGGGGVGGDSWGGFGDSVDSANKNTKEEGKDGANDGWGESLLSPPAGSDTKAASPGGVNDLSDMLGLSSARPSKPPSPKADLNTTSGFDFGMGAEQAPITHAGNDAPAAEETKPEEKKKDSNLGPNGKPLTKVQLKKKQQQEAKEAKEKADREFQEQLERDLAAEADAMLETGGGEEKKEEISGAGDGWGMGGGDGGGGDGGGGDAGGGDGWGNPEPEKKDEFANNANEEEKKGEEEEKKEEKKEDDEWGATAKKGKKKKGKK